MKIIYLCSARIPSRAANAVQTVKMCEAFAKNGHDLVLYGRTGDAPPETIFSRFGVDPCFRVRLFRNRGVKGTRILNFQVDVRRGIETDGPADLYFARDIVSLAAVAHHPIPKIFEAHRSMRGRTVECLLFRYVARQPSFQRLVVVSNGMATEYRSLFSGLRRDSIQVEPGAADDSIFHSPVPEDFTWPGRRAALQVGYVGHLYEGRGIELIAELARRLTTVDFHLVGGSEEDIARWKGMNPSSNFYLHGYVPHPQLGCYYRHFDVLISPYQKRVYAGGGCETSSVMSPLKLFEYMAAGKPSVCSDLPVLREVLHDREDTLLVTPDDADAWASALHTLERDRDLASSLGLAARRKFLTAHTWRARARSVLAGSAVTDPRATTPHAPVEALAG